MSSNRILSKAELEFRKKHVQSYGRTSSRALSDRQRVLYENLLPKIQISLDEVSKDNKYFNLITPVYF